MIRFSVALEKTFWGDTIMVFLGLLIDTINQVVCIPQDKVAKALNWVEFFLNKNNKKATVLQFQKLCRTLNFLCRCVIPGCAFLTRLYVRTTLPNGKTLKQHHHVRITNENRLDLLVWQHFLKYPQIFTRPFLDGAEYTADEIDFYSDVSRNFQKGFGAYYQNHWTRGVWDSSFMKENKSSI